MIVFGIGTGRCGTQSLAALLDAQNEARVTHERFGSSVPWGSRGRPYLKKILSRSDDIHSVRGDVAFYWLPQMEEILAKGGTGVGSYAEGLRIVALRRNKRETVFSYLRKTRGRDHWRVDPGDSYEACQQGWDQCFPKFQVPSKIEAIESYWEYYYGSVARLQKEYPQNVRCFDVDRLNSRSGQNAILEHVGIPEKDRCLIPEIRRNTGQEPQGRYGRLKLVLKRTRYWLTRCIE